MEASSPCGEAFAGADEVVLVGETVEFLGTGSAPDGEIVEYAWDFESDGVADFVSTTAGFTTHKFSAEGDYKCVLTVLAGRHSQQRM
ncbi:MAG: PKD domain-containing protein [Candidatus Eisenbacteria bacterium]